MIARSAILVRAALLALAPSAFTQATSGRLPERWRGLQQLPERGSPEIQALLEDISEIGYASRAGGAGA